MVLCSMVIGLLIVVVSVLLMKRNSGEFKRMKNSDLSGIAFKKIFVEDKQTKYKGKFERML